MLRVAIKLGAFPMPSVGTMPPEGMEGLKADLAGAHEDVEQYARKEYAAASLADAVRPQPFPTLRPHYSSHRGPLH